ncbi:MAG: hypothetical protein KY468_06450, partial [Armatimonadetes bacterium]|nr:hypothetical protein [Armatimonadota bacterium]
MISPHEIEFHRRDTEAQRTPNLLMNHKGHEEQKEKLKATADERGFTQIKITYKLICVYPRSSAV